MSQVATPPDPMRGRQRVPLRALDPDTWHHARVVAPDPEGGHVVETPRRLSHRRWALARKPIYTPGGFQNRAPLVLDPARMDLDPGWTPCALLLVHELMRARHPGYTGDGEAGALGASRGYRTRSSDGALVLTACRRDGPMFVVAFGPHDDDLTDWQAPEVAAADHPWDRLALAWRHLLGLGVLGLYEEPVVPGGADASL